MKDFYSHLNMEDITDADYTHEKRICKDFKIKKLGEYYDLVCSKWYIIVVSRFLAAPGLAWQAALKKKKVKLDLLTDIL